jgi:anaerobic magnesium-protoporphyrin IX monomethyl ester cyclase
MTKIVLVYFDINTGYYPSFNHGLAALMGQLKCIQAEVSLIHLSHTPDIIQAVQKIKEKNPEVLGLSFSTNQKRYVKTLFEHLDADPGFIVAGGVHATLVKEEILQEFPRLNAICIGEADYSFPDLIFRMQQGKEILATPGFYIRSENEIIMNPTPALRDLESYALPDYSLFDYDKIITQSGYVFPMMLMRGCPYNCSYCCNHAIKAVYPNDDYVRIPSVARAMAVIENNLMLFPKTQKIAFADDTFTLNKKWLYDFCSEYKKRINLPFICNARVETINGTVISALKDAGCISIDFGVETGNEWLRKNILNRAHSNATICETFALADRAGIKRFSFNMVGLPFETRAMAEDTIRLNMEIKPNFGKCFYFFPYPGSKIYQLCKEYNILASDLDSVSGYLEKPVIKPIFMTMEQTRAVYEKMQTFFYCRLLFSKIWVPKLVELILTYIFFLLRRPILMFLQPTKPNRLIEGIRRIFRKYGLKYLR